MHPGGQRRVRILRIKQFSFAQVAGSPTTTPPVRGASADHLEAQGADIFARAHVFEENDGMDMEFYF